MVLNNIINHLIIWCRGKAEVYRIAYKANGGGFDIGSTLAYELVFKLETLIDRPFESTDALKREVLDLLDVHYEPGILKPQNRTMQYIIDKVKMIHSLDSLKLAAEIDKQAKKRGIVIDVLVEVNCGEEENKSGLFPSEVEEFCLCLSQFGNIRHRGFMTMAPKCEKKEEYLKYFQQTYAQVLDIWTKKLHNISRPVISMGMSDSFEEAIACGSDIVRVGRRLFVK